jgi:hypothetical protein
MEWWRRAWCRWLGQLLGVPSRQAAWSADAANGGMGAPATARCCCHRTPQLPRRCGCTATTERGPPPARSPGRRPSARRPMLSFVWFVYFVLRFCDCTRNAVPRLQERRAFLVPLGLGGQASLHGDDYGVALSGWPGWPACLR